MSSAVVSTPAALGRPFVFDDDAEAEVGSPSSASRAALDRTAEGGCPHINLQAARNLPRPHSISNQQSKIKNLPGQRNPSLAARHPSRARDGFQRRPRHRRPDRRPAPRMPHRNLRPRLLRTHHHTLSRPGRRHPPRRILRGRRCQRRPRPPIRRRRRRGTGTFAVGALRRRCSAKKFSPQTSARRKENGVSELLSNSTLLNRGSMIRANPSTAWSKSSAPPTCFSKAEASA